MTKKLLRNTFLVAAALLSVSSTGCDLGAYEQRTKEPYGSKLESNAPAVEVESEADQDGEGN